MTSHGEPAQPQTGAVPVSRWRARIDPRPGLDRVRESAPAIAQIVLAATAAYAVAHYGFGHAVPLLAGTVTVSSLGFVRDARLRRVLETVIGMLVGIAVAEVLFVVLGVGWWQLAIVLGATLVVARFLAPQPAFAIAAAIQSLIVMVVPASSPFSRLIDAAIGAAAALVVTALIPRSPLRETTRDGRAVFAAFENAAATLVQGLRRGDRLRAERGLEKARGLQHPVDAWHGTLESALSIARISPFLRRRRAELARQERIRAQLDLASRNLRVIGRRVVYACDDGVPRPVAADVLAELARGADLLSQSLGDISLEPVARESLRAVAGRLDPAAMLPGSSQGDQSLLAAMRPLAVDLLTATGMPPHEARATLPRV